MNEFFDIEIIWLRSNLFLNEKLFGKKIRKGITWGHDFLLRYFIISVEEIIIIALR